MIPSKDDSPPPVSFGLASLSLGTIALGLFFMPILGASAAALGMASGLAGVVASRLGRGESLRWALGGLCVSAYAFVIVLALLYAPLVEEPIRQAPGAWPMAPQSGFVPPPARPNSF
jgi:dolichol kinase